MIRDPVVEWQELSALYEQAESLDQEAQRAWLAALDGAAARLRPQLERMFDARALAADEGFLEELPALADTAATNAPLAAVTEWGRGSQIGPYRLTRHLGSGGMAEVWLADRVDGAFERTVAIKLLFDHPGYAHRESYARRFERERDILASLDHSHIAGLHDAGVTSAGQPWLALEYVEGKPLTTWCDEQRLTIAGRIDIFTQVLLAVEHAHASLVIHRDLKPANILVTPSGDVKLLDFGIAKLIDAGAAEQGDSDLTRQGGRPMTLKYASPEQLAGRALTTASDQYSLGVILYELLSGESPYEMKADTAAQMEAAVIAFEPRVPSRRTLSARVVEARQTTRGALAKLLSTDLDAVPLKALRKAQQDRYASIEAMRLDLGRWRDCKPLLVKAPTAVYRLGRFVRRHSLGVAAGSLATLGLVGVTVGAVAMEYRARHEAERAVAAKNFIVDVFRLSDPDTSPGSQLNTNQLLESGSSLAANGLKHQPDLQASVLLSIGTMQYHVGQYGLAKKSLTQAATAFDRLGNVREAALTRCLIAETMFQLGDYGAAGGAIDLADAGLKRLGRDHELHTKIALMRGYLEVRANDMGAAETSMRLALQEAQSAFGVGDVKTVDAMRGLSDVLEQKNHGAEATALLDQAVSVLQRGGLMGGRDLINIAGERAALYFRNGHYSAAARIASATIADCDRLLSAQNSDCVRLRIFAVDALVRVHDFAAASAYLPQLQTAARIPELADKQVFSLIATVRMAAAAGSLKDHDASVLQLEAASENASVALNLRILAALARAEAAVFVPDAQGVLTWSERGRSLIGGSATPLHGRMARALVLHALGEQLLGRHEKSLSLLSDAQAEATVVMDRTHPLSALYELNRIPSLVALGRSGEAEAVLKASHDTLRTEIDSAAPFWKELDVLKVMIEQKRLSSVTLPFFL